MDREQGGIGGRVLARRALGAGAPGIATFALLAALEQIAVPTALLGGLLCLLGGAWSARRQLLELEGVAGRIAGLAQGRDGTALPEVTGPVADRLRRPLGDLARRLRVGSERMAAQRRMLDSLIEALPDPIIVVDQQLDVIQANAAARHSFDASPTNLPLVRILRDPGVLAAATAALTGTAASSVAFTPSSDRTKQFSARIEPLDLGEHRRGVLLALREQTEEVMIERMRSDFVANASHEIRTPLASIQGFIETLRGPARHDSHARESFLEIMAQEADRMSRLVDDLLSLSRIELAAHQPPRDRCDLSEVVAQAVASTRAVAEQGRVTIALDLPTGLPVVVGDTDQLHQLLVNLIDNAIKYGGEGTTVTVAAAALGAAPADAGAASGRPSIRVAVT
ncbi:MAG: sensor histidine kinase, partial [Geminicoccaceae bacterium]